MRRLRWAHVLLWILLPALALVTARIAAAPRHLLTTAREVAVLPAIAIVAVALFRLFLPTWRIAAACVSALLIAMFGYGLRWLAVAVWPVLDSTVPQRITVPLWVGLTVLAGRAVWVRRARLKLAEAEKVLWAAGVGCLLAVVASNIIAHRQVVPAFLPGTASAPRGAQARDIYYIVLDSYPSLEILKTRYGFADPTFERLLRTRGFRIVPNARSNYAMTGFSMASSLNLDLLSYLGVAGVNGSESVLPERLIEQNRLMRYLKSWGYAVYHVGALDVSEDLVESSEELRFTNRFLVRLLDATPFQRFGAYTWEPWDQRYRVLGALQTVRDIATKPGPKFVYAHILCPHGPFVFGARGESVSPWNAIHHPREAFLDQVAFLDEQVRTVLDAVFRAGQPEPVVIIQGDHGIEDTIAPSVAPTDEQKTAQMAILNAYYFPSSMNTGLYGTITPANSFRVVLNAMFGEELPLVEDRSFFSTRQRPFKFEEVTIRSRK